MEAGLGERRVGQREHHRVAVVDHVGLEVGAMPLGHGADAARQRRERGSRGAQLRDGPAGADVAVAGQERGRAVVVDAHQLGTRGDARVAQPPQRKDVPGDVAVLELRGALEPQDVDGPVVRAERRALVAEAVHLEQLGRGRRERDVLSTNDVSRQSIVTRGEMRAGERWRDRFLHERHDGHPCHEG